MTLPSVSEEMIRALKPCPFCNARGEDLMIFCDPNEGSDNSGASRRIQCARCNIEAPFYPSEREAILAWNRRAHLPAGSEAVKDARVAAQEIWQAWASFYSAHFRGTGIGLSMADQQAFHEIAQPILSALAAPPATPPAANLQDEATCAIGQITEGGSIRLDKFPLTDLAGCHVFALRSKQAPTVAVPDEGVKLSEDEVISGYNALQELRLQGDPCDMEIVQTILKAALRARAEQREAPSSVVGEGWIVGINSVPYATTVLATYLDHDLGEWVMDLFCGTRPSAPYTHWRFVAAPTSDER
jgi:hypothetical protein